MKLNQNDRFGLGELIAGEHPKFTNFSISILD